MARAESISLPSSLVERLRREASKLGVSLDEYLIDVLTRNLDPEERAREYLDAARVLLERAKEEIARGDVRQAAEKLWGATALAVKAYAAWREGRRLASHGELWEYSLVLRRELGRWVSDAWNAGNAMHTCFHEGWCKKEHLEDALEEIERLVKAVASKIKPSR